jgi:hypothetical protein
LLSGSGLNIPCLLGSDTLHYLGLINLDDDEDINILESDLLARTNDDALIQGFFKFDAGETSTGGQLTDVDPLLLLAGSEARQWKDQNFVVMALRGDAGANVVFSNGTGGTTTFTVAPIPLPAAAWLFGSALLGLGILKKRRTAV